LSGPHLSVLFFLKPLSFLKYPVGVYEIPIQINPEAGFPGKVNIPFWINVHMLLQAVAIPIP